MTIAKGYKDGKGGDRRGSERREIHFELYVTDLDQDTPLGDVVNLSLSGMRVMGEAPIPIDTIWRVQLNIVLGENATEPVCFETRIVWSRYVEDLRLYETGCANTLSLSATARIEHLLNSLTTMAEL